MHLTGGPPHLRVVLMGATGQPGLDDVIAVDSVSPDARA
jgi:hypothetical protein